MKPQLLHGPAINASRNTLVKIKQKFDRNNVVVFEQGTNSQTILGNLATPALFSDQQLIVMENPPEDFTSSLTAENYQLVCWFDHQVDQKKPLYEWFKIYGQILYFAEDKETLIFPFLDFLAYSDQKAYLQMQKLKSSGHDVFYFINMTYYLLRNLVANPKNAPYFVKDKLARQRKRFPIEKITRLYQEILEMEFKIKSGLLEKDQAEFLLVNKFIENRAL